MSTVFEYLSCAIIEYGIKFAAWVGAECICCFSFSYHKNMLNCCRQVDIDICSRSGSFQGAFTEEKGRVNVI